MYGTLIELESEDALRIVEWAVRMAGKTYFEVLANSDMLARRWAVVSEEYRCSWKSLIGLLRRAGMSMSQIAIRSYIA